MCTTLMASFTGKLRVRLCLYTGTETGTMQPMCSLSVHVVAFDDAAQDSLAFGQILKMDHATQIQLA